MAGTDIMSWASHGTPSIPKGNNNHNMPPSKVIHCRAVAEGCKETDLVEVMKLFGNVKALKLMPKICQGLVQFEELEAAIACVTYSNIQPILVHGRQMYVNYSKSTEIKREFNNSTQEQTPTSILLFTVINVIHLVNVETIKKICQQQNTEVQRIVIFHKNGLQALVEFKTIEDASRIQQTLNGCDVYPGCCSLRIDYSKTTKLNVRSNTSELFNIDIEDNSHISALLADAEGFPAVQSILAKAVGSSQAQYTSPFTSEDYSNDAAGGEGCVAMVYGINNEIMNCDHLYNLFCLYGNIAKIKILLNKPGCAMVQYADRLCTEIAIQYLNNLTLFGQQLRITFSKHPFIVESSQTPPVFDGSPSVVSYYASRNNRFKSPQGGRNQLFSRIHHPTKVLHYFNAPPDCTEQQIEQLFQSANAEVPLKQTSISKPGGKSSSGLLEFSSIITSVEALILVNHLPLNKDDDVCWEDTPKAPFKFKLAFSPSESINK